ncbi:MAG: M4 family metallopeptidase, partial [Acidobacteriota bacterium]|nr:M4 family metallopeptidase [Acidobacteriota bacterium]
MKKFLSIFAALIVAFVAFAFVTRNAEADKTVFGKGAPEDLARVQQISLDFLAQSVANRAVGGIGNLKAQSVEIDDLKMAHTKVRQTVNDVPVWEGEAIVHLKADGSLASITDDLKDRIAVSTEPNFSADEARKIVANSNQNRVQNFGDAKTDLWIYRGEDRDHLAYRVSINDSDNQINPSMPVIFIDAQTGETIFKYDNLQTGTGSSLYSGTVSINTSVSGSTYYMEDLTRKQGTFNMNNTGNVSTGTGGTQSRYTDTDDVWNTTNQRAGVDAHYGAAKTLDYYKNVQGRNGIDGNYGPGTTTAAANSSISLLVSRVHFGSGYNNAFWNGSNMTYGDGDGTSFTPLTTVDICGHEMTHGVTERTAGLTYSKESGALNEAMSDIMGSMVELYADGGVVSGDTWKIGEDAYTPGTAGDALRRMDDPHAVGDPDHYSVRVYPGTCTPNSNTNDNCGVHTNSSIVNHTYYLNAAGGTNRVSGVTVPSIGTGAAEKIWFRALTVYMTSGTTFAQARTATLSAATDLYGASSSQYNSVATAWCAVGVGACPTGGTPTPTPTATPTPNPTPTPGGGGELVSNGGFETSASPWVSSGTGYFYTNNGTY